MKKFEELTMDELVNAASQICGMTPAEVKDNFPTEDKLRAFILDAKKSRGIVNVSSAEEDALGWDKTDKTPLDDHAKKTVGRLRKAEKEALNKSIKTGGGQVTQDEVSSAMKDVHKLLDDDDGDD